MGRQNICGQRPLLKMAFRLYNMWCGVIVAPTSGPHFETNSTASLVVMCSMTTFNFGFAFTTGPITSLRKTFSRSKKSTLGVNTSPWIRSGMPIAAISLSAGKQFLMSVTPDSELVVTPFGYSFTAYTCPEALASFISSGDVLSVMYNVIRGVNSIPSGSPFSILSRYARAIFVLMTGGFKFGMMMALPIPFICFRQLAVTFPSRRCK
mmetsp:Transcript_45775/g.73624  ORF Transcript_45775/g.73624 Transcript_45775/m.73624 type:complete len:208 (-) Transcript_45775:96-719(-)